MSSWSDDNEDDLEQIVVELQHMARIYRENEFRSLSELLDRDDAASSALLRAIEISLKVGIPPSAREFG